MRLTSEFVKVASANGDLSTSARLVGEISDQAASVYVMTRHWGMSLCSMASLQPSPRPAGWLRLRKPEYPDLSQPQELSLVAVEHSQWCVKSISEEAATRSGECTRLRS